MLIDSAWLKVNLFVWLIILYYLVFMYSANNSMKKMRKLKAERGFRVNTKRYVDLSLSNEFEKLRIGKKAWLIPIIIFVVEFL